MALTCGRDPVSWSETIPLPAPPAVVDSEAALEMPHDRPPMLATPLEPPLPAGWQACPHSVATAPARPDEWYATYWTVRSDSSVLLEAAKTTDGGAHWSSPVVIDERDRSTLGCSRPAPSIATVPAKGYVQVVYALSPPGGAGIFLTHSMEHCAMWHPPVGILFGERIVRTGVAAAGDTVAVGYEDPTEVGRIALALSFTAGHVFDVRVPVSGDGQSGFRPSVALDGRRVAISWLASGTPGAEERRLVRIGTLP